MRLRLAVRRYARPFRVPLRTGRGPWSTREGLLLRIENEAGRVGWGEAAPVPWFPGLRLDDMEARLRACGDFVSKDVLASLFTGGSAAFAVRQALEELENDPPLLPSKAVPVAALLPSGRDARTALQARLEEGFRTFKWKVGVLPAADEWVVLDELLGDLPSGARLRLDANGAWDRVTAERWLARAAERPIDFIEQPIAHEGARAVDLLLGLANDYPTPLALDESLGDETQVRTWLDLGWPGVWVLKLPLLGDPAATITPLLQRRARLVFSSALEGPIARRAVWPLIQRLPEACAPIGYGLGPLFGDPLWDGLPLVPFLRPSDLPAPNPEVLWTSLA